MGRVERSVGSLALLLLWLVPNGPARAIGATSVDAFDPSGDYHIADQALSGLVDHFYFDIEVRRRRGRLIAWGHVHARSTVYRIRAITISRERLSYTTATVRGVAFRFEGQFTRQGAFATQFEGDGIIAMRGTMIKVVNGVVDTVATSEFLYYPGC